MFCICFSFIFVPIHCIITDDDGGSPPKGGNAGEIGICFLDKNKDIMVKYSYE